MSVSHVAARQIGNDSERPGQRGEDHQENEDARFRRMEGRGSSKVRVDALLGDATRVE